MMVLGGASGESLEWNWMMKMSANDKAESGG